VVQMPGVVDGQVTGLAQGRHGAAGLGYDVELGGGARELIATLHLRPHKEPKDEPDGDGQDEACHGELHVPHVPASLLLAQCSGPCHQGQGSVD
jgi:hypothetical protein